MFRRRVLTRCTVGFIVACSIFILLWERDTLSNKRANQVPQRMSDQTCIHPRLPLYDPTINKFFHDVPATECDTEENWVYVKNGTFRISESAKIKYKDIHCQYVPIVRGIDDYETGKGTLIDPMIDGAKLLSDFFEVACDSADGNHYFNVHSAITYNENKLDIKPPKYSMGLNVLMFGFDSVSRMTWMRTLPKSHKYFTENMNGIVLQGYNILGDGTPQALFPLLTGKNELELPEARRGYEGARTLDESPWIWNEFEGAGYVTQWAEDMANIGTFTMRMLGFTKQPVHHYMRPYYLRTEPMHSKNKPFCMGSVSRLKVLLDWVKDLFVMYETKPKFSFGFHGEYSHSDINMLQLADEELKNFLIFLNEKNYLNTTLVILMSDHGARFNEIRKTVQGKLEERMPYFAFRFPKWFKKVYPKAFNNFKINTQRLTTPFDIYETFRDIINFTGADSDVSNKRGISLFKEIPRQRSCSDAGIAPHWCACNHWKELKFTEPNVNLSLKEVVETINKLLNPFSANCELLRLDEITKCLVYTPKKEMLKFKGSVDRDGRIADLTDEMATEEEYYQVTFYTMPCHGHFEATVKHNLLTNTFDASGQEISRINKYGSDSACIVDKSPELRPYCCCRKTTK